MRTTYGLYIAASQAALSSVHIERFRSSACIMRAEIAESCTIVISIHTASDSAREGPTSRTTGSTSDRGATITSGLQSLPHTAYTRRMIKTEIDDERSGQGISLVGLTCESKAG